jgi:hypothetical protein
MIKAPPQVRRDLAEAFFFRPNPSIRRVITIATPFRGSNLANTTTRWISNKLIKLPEMLINDRQQLHKDNPGLLRPSNLVDVATSIDALSPDSPILPVMLESPRVDWVRYHNIVGRIPDKGLIGRVVGGSDGVVSFESAHLQNVTSEITVNADHLELTRHPLSVLEVHRILLDHLISIDAPPRPKLEYIPWTASRDNAPPVGGATAAAPAVGFPAAVAAPPNGALPQPAPTAQQPQGPGALR